MKNYGTEHPESYKIHAPSELTHTSDDIQLPEERKVRKKTTTIDNKQSYDEALEKYKKWRLCGIAGPFIVFLYTLMMMLLIFPATQMFLIISFVLAFVAGSYFQHYVIDERFSTPGTADVYLTDESLTFMKAVGYVWKWYFILITKPYKWFYREWIDVKHYFTQFEFETFHRKIRNKKILGILFISPFILIIVFTILVIMALQHYGIGTWA